jgi:hypothetical protein
MPFLDETCRDLKTATASVYGFDNKGCGLSSSISELGYGHLNLYRSRNYGGGMTMAKCTSRP